MKVLSLMQPWATLVSIGAKRIETRSWATKYRGPLAIHAGKGGLPAVTERELCASEPFAGALEMVGIRTIVGGAPVNPAFYRGSILCVCDLVDCVRITAENVPPEPERSFGDYMPGRFAWHLTNVRMLSEPIPAKGMLGLWTPAPELLAEIMRRVA